MKILVTSYHYAPSIGGIETVSKLMVEAFRAKGHEVIVVTSTLDPEGKCDSTVKIVRQPGIAELWALAGWADVVWQNNIALTYLWAFRLRRVPTAVTLACAVFPSLPKKRIRERLKHLFLTGCYVFSISDYVIEGTSLKHEKIGNPFEESISEIAHGVEKQKDIVFLGRLVSDKGADLLVDALQLLKKSGLAPTCTIIGDGPERNALEDQVASTGLGEQVRFTGYLSGDELYREMAKHRILAVPSRWKEPFGVVALEGIASGCAVVGSESGGLPEAIGPCGLTFPNGHAEAFAGCLKPLLSDSKQLETLTRHAESHLAQFRVETQSQKYLRVFDQITVNQSIDE
jgi:glycosyltransferase involved in cell wall biosynthesis